MTRRESLQKAGATTLGAAATGLTAPSMQGQDAGGGGAHKRSIKKGIMWATVGLKGSVLEKMQALKAAGFDGVEMMSHMDQDEVVKARDQVGLVIPSVCGRDHWGKPLSDPNPSVREEGLEALKQT